MLISNERCLFIARISDKIVRICNTNLVKEFRKCLTNMDVIQRGYYSLVPSHVYRKLLSIVSKPLWSPLWNQPLSGRLERFSYWWALFLWVSPSDFFLFVPVWQFLFQLVTHINLACINFLIDVFVIVAAALIWVPSKRFQWGQSNQHWGRALRYEQNCFNDLFILETTTVVLAVCCEMRHLF